MQNAISTKINSSMLDYDYLTFKLINKKASSSQIYNLELSDNLIAIIHGFIL